MRGATAPLPRVSRWRGYFNPRAPCGARRARGSLRRGAINISIHAPHAGRDEINAAVMRSPPYFNPRAPCGARPVWCVYVDIHCTFQSTRPMRGATGFCAKMAVPMKDISIHAPHAGRDACWRESKSRERTFQSTRPMRGATAVLQAGLRFKRISIHAPHAGRDGRAAV